ncbi:hypothetical protein QBC40DRAFT_59935 [Triangularia verruculosa]|uniref:DRBM domain-containing protein n=1 Tax=Triangularia verruculosa TaxID=2587418 RepID=A0AAN6XJR0_9PEZI|nr:hypothetical protein QBC40DRAFT_59935 [Triangularia verruculosa]
MAHKTSSSKSPWQDCLTQTCLDLGVQAPVFQVVSDRRGGRTAWSSRVTVHGSTISARFWYDGKNLNNAKEDAAEVALTWLNGGSSNPSSPSTTRSGW